MLKIMARNATHILLTFSFVTLTYEFPDLCIWGGHIVKYYIVYENTNLIEIIHSKFSWNIFIDMALVLYENIEKFY
jgi:hypothetical protein